MAAMLRHWREASTLILITARHKGSADIMPTFVSSCTRPTGTDDHGDAINFKLKAKSFDVLLLKRSAKSKFMPSLYVFPGGVASDVDFSAEWISVFDSLGKDHRQKLFDFALRGGPGAPMFNRLREEQFSHVPSEIAFRICAIRETFEESGVLIARRTHENGKCSKPSPWAGATWASYIDDEATISEWRHRVNEDPREFLRMCQELDMVPDVWSLYEWSNWLTPRESQHRFDTAFFVCCLQDRPRVAEDEGEMVHCQWGSPYDILHEYYRARVNLAPPQVYEIGRLMGFTSVPDLLKFAWHRGQHRVQQWMPVHVVSSDRVMTVLPGDSLYPEDTEPDSPPVTVTHDKTLAELDESHPNKHRVVFIANTHGPQGAKCACIICNIALPGEHVAPPNVAGSKLFTDLSPQL